MFQGCRFLIESMLRDIKWLQPAPVLFLYYLSLSLSLSLSVSIHFPLVHGTTLSFRAKSNYSNFQDWSTCTTWLLASACHLRSFFFFFFFFFLFSLFFWVFFFFLFSLPFAFFPLALLRI
ncbi:hypothetical protein ACN38_g909 [Penicillium nordicum]|uniref:Uncharacterized protein n=1 Tax=Penicillium nordicum TaxID=229535 RepID=A0A0M8PGD1_9EURO|nr:hypothetical protein ACN38_g909 [Penicillium nordicum]